MTAVRQTVHGVWVFVRHVVLGARRPPPRPAIFYDQDAPLDPPTVLDLAQVVAEAEDITREAAQ